MKVDFIPQEQFDTYLKEFITKALDEDIGSGDHTSLSCIPEDSNIEAKLLVKDSGIIAGIDLAEIILKQINPKVKVVKAVTDGEVVNKADIAFTVKGPARAILTGERLLLNFMQRLSGIATRTNFLVNLVKDYNTKLLDTRKTTPGLRLLEKWAVKIGGGGNHRIGLYDMILIKDNHIDHAGGISKAVNLTRKYLTGKKLELYVIVEIRTFEEMEEALTLNGIDRLLLDNFEPNVLARAIKIINKRISTEASGGINEKNIIDYAKSGVDFISCGALTNSIRSLDLSLKVM